METLFQCHMGILNQFDLLTSFPNTFKTIETAFTGFWACGFKETFDALHVEANCCSITITLILKLIVHKCFVNCSFL
jgi:hypothetical protein